jgi:hypothetical protein
MDSAPRTYGVRPLAVTPTTRSPATASAITARPALSSSSAPSDGMVSACAPPAMCATTRPGGRP